MHSRATVDSMASDSYLLQVPCSAPPCQCKCQCHSKHRSSTPCGVVVALVVLLAAVMTLAALAYCQRMDLLDMHDHVDGMHKEFHAASSKLDWLHKFELIKTYETSPSASTPSPCGKSDHDHDDDDSSDLDEDDHDYDDEYDPIYQDMEDTNVVEGKALSQEDGGAAVPVPLEPASGHKLSEDPAAASTTAAPTPAGPLTVNIPAEQWSIRRRRDARQAGRPQPQLKLYHMLQTPGLSAAAPPPDQWSPYGARYPQDHGRPQPMYAEHAPMAYVTPPQRRLGTSTAAPVASRRSRVMDGMVVPTNVGPQQQQLQQQHRRRHQQHQQQRQRAFQQQHLQDVTQEVPQGGAARSVEVGRPRWQQQQQQQQGRGVQAQPAWPSSTPRPSSSWSPTERPGWREPWQDRVRAPRSIDASVDVDQTWRPYSPVVVEGPPIAGHFVGDTSRHRGSHHYDDNGRLKHPTGEYADWTASSWVSELGLDHHFKLAPTGAHITVDAPGLYLVYAQVNYANDKDENGFWVYRNQQKELLCATAGASGQDVRANTCFTAGVLHLAKGDRVSLKDLAGDRYRVLDHPGRSFVGMVNLSACKLKTEQPGRSTVAD